MKNTQVLGVVLLGCAALAAGVAMAFGVLMTETGRSSFNVGAAHVEEVEMHLNLPFALPIIALGLIGAACLVIPAFRRP